MVVRWAVLPIAGGATRWRPLSALVPKFLSPVLVRATPKRPRVIKQQRTDGLKENATSKPQLRDHNNHRNGRRHRNNNHNTTNADQHGHQPLPQHIEHNASQIPDMVSAEGIRVSPHPLYAGEPASRLELWPLLQLHLRNLALAGVNEVVLVVNYKSKQHMDLITALQRMLQASECSPPPVHNNGLTFDFDASAPTGDIGHMYPNIHFVGQDCSSSPGLGGALMSCRPLLQARKVDRFVVLMPDHMFVDGTTPALHQLLEAACPTSYEKGKDDNDPAAEPAGSSDVRPSSQLRLPRNLTGVGTCQAQSLQHAGLVGLGPKWRSSRTPWVRSVLALKEKPSLAASSYEELCMFASKDLDGSDVFTCHFGMDVLSCEDIFPALEDEVARAIKQQREACLRQAMSQLQDDLAGVVIDGKHLDIGNADAFADSYAEHCSHLHRSVTAPSAMFSLARVCGLEPNAMAARGHSLNTAPPDIDNHSQDLHDNGPSLPREKQLTTADPVTGNCVLDRARRYLPLRRATAAWMPGRLDILGGFADYNGSRCLAVPTQAGTWCIAEFEPVASHHPQSHIHATGRHQRTSFAVHIRNEAANPGTCDESAQVESVCVSLEDLQSVFRHHLEDEEQGEPSTCRDARSTLGLKPEALKSLRYTLGPFVALTNDVALPKGTVHIYVEGDLPQCSGLASSASLQLAATTAVAGCLNVELSTPVFEACFGAEAVLQKVRCGALDYLAIGNAAPTSRHLMELDCSPSNPRVIAHHELPQAVGIHALYVGQDRPHGSLQGSCYNDIRSASEQALADLQDLLQSAGFVSAARRLTQWCGHAALNSERGWARRLIRDHSPTILPAAALFPIQEHERALALLRAIQDSHADLTDNNQLISRLQQLLKASQDGYEAAGASCPAASWLHASSIQDNCGFRLSGGGFGGFGTCIVPAATSPKQLQNMLDKIEVPPFLANQEPAVSRPKVLSRILNGPYSTSPCTRVVSLS